MTDILYECECERRNVTPKQFFAYCKNRVAEKGIDFETWITFEDWTSEKFDCDSISKHDDWDIPCEEICRMKPYDWQLFLADNYNFIMEFNFDDDKKGFGYMYVRENVR